MDSCFDPTPPSETWVGGVSISLRRGWGCCGNESGAPSKTRVAPITFGMNVACTAAFLDQLGAQTLSPDRQPHKIAWSCARAADTMGRAVSARRAGRARVASFTPVVYRPRMGRWDSRRRRD
jgi:hypothetical protein